MAWKKKLLIYEKYIIKVICKEKSSLQISMNFSEDHRTIKKICNRREPSQEKRGYK